MKRFNERYSAASGEHDPGHKAKLTRQDWGPWVDWARPDPGDHRPPSWFGRDDVPPISRLGEITFGVRRP